VSAHATVIIRIER